TRTRYLVSQTVLHLHFVAPWYLVISSIQKEVFITYMLILISVLAVDRWIATKYWRWYDNNNNATIGFFLLQEFVVHAIAYAEGSLLIFVKIFFICKGYVAIYRHNLHEHERMKIKYSTSSYSVSKTYQIKENIALLQLFNRVALPLVISAFIAASFYVVYRFLPQGFGFDNLRYICAAMFNLGVAISCVVVALAIPINERKIIQYLLVKSIEKVSPSSQFNEHTSVTNAYFSMLKKEWQ
ncbi:hypothetical protein PMAYCL1PPCAC_17255, partial [Pristionchus mayeri]